MTSADRIERKHQAYKALAAYAKDRARLDARRDPVVREAVAAGIPKREVAAIISVARSTVYDILARKNGQENEAGR